MEISEIAFPHGDAHIGGMQRRGVVDPVTGHGDDLPVGLHGLHEGELLIGRGIFANLRKALTFIVAVHVPIAGLALVPILLGLPPVFFPMHVVLLELVIDPVCSVVFEAEPGERDAMNRPPRPAREPLFGTRQPLLGIFQGAVILAAVLALHVLALDRDLPAIQARALAFTGLVITSLSLAFAGSAEPGTCLFAAHRLVFFAIAPVAVLIVGMILLLPPLAAIFDAERPSWPALALTLGTGLLAGGASCALPAAAFVQGKLPPEARDAHVTKPLHSGQQNPCRYHYYRKPRGPGCHDAALSLPLRFS